MIPTRNPDVPHATKPNWGLYAVSFVARRRKSLRAIVTFRDLYEIPRLAWQLVLAWTLPEAAWWSISRMLGRLNVAMHPTRTRKEMAQISALHAGTPMASSPQRVAVANWSNRYEERFQYLRAWRPGGWNPQIDMVGIEHISLALNKGHGIVFWSGNFSFNWLVPKIAMRRLGLSVMSFSVPLHGISRTRFGVRYLNRVYRDIENRYLGERLMVKPEDFPTALQRMRDCLKLNGIVHFAVGGRGRRTETAKLLGDRVIIATGPIATAYAMGAALLPVYVFRLAPKRFEVIFGADIERPKDWDSNGDYAAAVQAYTDALAPYILRDPGQWCGWRLTEARRPWRSNPSTRR